MRATVAANIVNIALAVLFIFVLGWGVAGAAYATVIAHTVESGLLVISQHEIGGWSLAGVRPSHARALLRVGVPSGFQLTLEVGAFALLSLLVSRFSEADMAAHQIALQGIHFSFLPALALGEAASVIAGQAVGAGRDDLVRRIGRTALALAAAYTGTCALALALGRGALVRAFTSDPEVVSKAATLLLIGAAFQVADGANVVGRGVLRGAGDVRFAAIVGVTIAWMATPPLTWLLGYRAGLGAVGGWLGLFVEIVSGAALFWWRIERGGYQAAAERSRADLKRSGAEAPALGGAEAIEPPLGSIASSG
jgi:MATE family multidrug resistance protein